jgi:hypothetical protein
MQVVVRLPGSGAECHRFARGEGSGAPIPTPAKGSIDHEMSESKGRLFPLLKSVPLSTIASLIRHLSLSKEKFQ